VFRTDNFEPVAAIPVGNLPHGVWPSGDGSRIYVALENADTLVAVDTSTNRVIATSPIGQAAQAITYVPNAVTDGDGTQNLQPLGVGGQAAYLSLAPVAANTAGRLPTSIALYDQGITQVLEAAVTGLPPMQPHVLALASKPDGSGSLEPLAAFTTNPAGSAVVNAVGPIRQIVQSTDQVQRRYLVIVPGTIERLGAPVQVQAK